MAFSKILIANRGEIACRVIRTARRMGYRTVAVFSDADRAAPHVAAADEAVRIGQPAPSDSYLRIEAILEAARRANADAIHPGYGFLSENASFARACADADILLIGPPAEAMAIMGDKARAKARMVDVGVPVLPGSAVASAAAAEGIGYPVMVKAVAGGGGRGMRLVHAATDLSSALETASREAQSAFGDGALMLEKFVARGRHIEFQIFVDAHGNCVHLGERDCTAQRRRQKVIEESPSPVVSDALRAGMGKAAVRAARAVGYRGAGTIEFILDEDGQFFFLEMNTRLQVEHPVTECVTGLDLVEWQLRVGNGEKLPLLQAEISFAGHAIEARLCAEDPYDAFAPQTGVIRYWRPDIAHIRIDHGATEGGEISPFYDSLVAKFIAHGATRDDARRRLMAGLEASPLLGVPTNAGFLKTLLRSEDFCDGHMHTGTIDEWAGTSILQRPAPGERVWALAAAILASPRDGFRNRGGASYGMTLHIGDEVAALRVAVNGRDVIVQNGARETFVRIRSRDHESIGFEIAGVQGRAVVMRNRGSICLAVDGEVWQINEASPMPAAALVTDSLTITAPVTGQLLSILPVGSAVAAGDVIAVIEAMKIETRICAWVTATVDEVFAAAGTQVAAKKILATLVPVEAGA
jgi:geranyl-CoA carboxylase alpha subunit